MDQGDKYRVTEYKQHGDTWYQVEVYSTTWRFVTTKNSEDEAIAYARKLAEKPTERVIWISYSEAEVFS